MDFASARHLAATGMLFIPSDSRIAQKKPDPQAIHREMVEALGAFQGQIPVPLVVTAPSPVFDEVYNAIANGVFSDNLKRNFVCLHGEGEIQFVPK